MGYNFLEGIFHFQLSSQRILKEFKSKMNQQRSTHTSGFFSQRQGTAPQKPNQTATSGFYRSKPHNSTLMGDEKDLKNDFNDILPNNKIKFLYHNQTKLENILDKACFFQLPSPPKKMGFAMKLRYCFLKLFFFLLLIYEIS